MATFLLFGKYSPQALQELSIQRTDKAKSLVAHFGGEVKAIYAALGPNDLLFIVDLPGTEEAMKASVALTKLTGIALTTSPAVPVEDFDRMMSEL